MKWNAKDWIAFILAVTIPVFIIGMFILRAFGNYHGIESELGVEGAKLWLTFMGSLVTGLLVFISNKNGNNNNNNLN